MISWPLFARRLINNILYLCTHFSVAEKYCVAKKNATQKLHSNKNCVAKSCDAKIAFACGANVLRREKLRRKQMQLLRRNFLRRSFCLNVFSASQLFATLSFFCAAAECVQSKGIARLQRREQMELLRRNFFASQDFASQVFLRRRKIRTELKDFIYEATGE